MMICRVFRPGFYILATSLFLTSGISANDISTVDQEWLKSIHESWVREDADFKNSPTSPLAGTSRFEISEANTVYFTEKDGQLGWSIEQAGQSAFSMINSGGQWWWTRLDEDVSLSREDTQIPSGSFLVAGD